MTNFGASQMCFTFCDILQDIERAWLWGEMLQEHEWFWLAKEFRKVIR